jgi:hypothetical protein
VVGEPESIKIEEDSIDEIKVYFSPERIYSISITIKDKDGGNSKLFGSEKVADAEFVKHYKIKS